MSNDLISRSALLESVNYYYTHTPNDSPEHYAYGVALKKIREHPTAFDKKRVIEKINREIEYHHEKSKIASMEIRAYSDGAERAYRLLRSIVEKGGIE